MSVHSKVVVVVTDPTEEAANRVETMLDDFAASHDRYASFLAVAGEESLPGHGTTFVGGVNYLDETDLMERLRTAAQDPSWSTFYAALVLVTRNDDQDHKASVRVLNQEGVWV